MIQLKVEDGIGLPQVFRVPLSRIALVDGSYSLDRLLRDIAALSMYSTGGPYRRIMKLSYVDENGNTCPIDSKEHLVRGIARYTAGNHIFHVDVTIWLQQIPQIQQKRTASIEDAMEDDDSSCMIGFPGENVGGVIDCRANHPHCTNFAAISADGTIIAVGSPIDKEFERGAVRVYQLVNDAWTPRGRAITAMEGFDRCGWSVAMSDRGNVVAIASVGGRNAIHGNDQSQVEVFAYHEGQWYARGSPLMENNKGFGFSLSLSSDGQYMAVGSPRRNGNTGHVKVYKFCQNVWAQAGDTIVGQSAGAECGWSVGISTRGDVVAIGSPGSDTKGQESGEVNVYKYSREKRSHSWKPKVRIIGEAAGDRCGHSLALAPCGNIVAVGSPHSNSNGYRSGNVSVFAQSKGKWVKASHDIVGEESGDCCGYSVALSAYGSKLAVGSPENRYAGHQSGETRVYERINGGWTLVEDSLVGKKPNDRCGQFVILSKFGSSVAASFHGDALEVYPL